MSAWDEEARARELHAAGPVTSGEFSKAVETLHDAVHELREIRADAAAADKHTTARLDAIVTDSKKARLCLEWIAAIAVGFAITAMYRSCS